MKSKTEVLVPEVLKVYLSDHCGHGEVEMLRDRPRDEQSRLSYEVTGNLREADIVVFAGGADIDPLFYGHERLRGTYLSPGHDKSDWELFKEATSVHAGMKATPEGSKKKLLAGICRGGQFLNAMAGGTLYQHVTNHSGKHDVQDYVDGNIYHVNSVHHQQMIPNYENGAVLVAGIKGHADIKVAWDSKLKSEVTEVNDNEDVEVVWYPEQRFLCFQAHPEYGYEPCTDYFFKLLERYY